MHPERFSKVLTDGSNLWTLTVNRLFPAGKLAVIAVLKNGQTAGFISLLLFLSASALAFFILIVLGEKLYFRGIFGKPSGIYRIRAPERLNLSETARADSAFKTYLMKDLRVLFRDPVFFMNCILTNFFLPVLIVFFSSVGGGESKGQITALLARASDGGIFYAVGLGFCILLTSMNAIASSAISREGKNLSVAKYLPVSYQKQILAKAAAGAAMGGAGCLLMVLVAVFWFHVPVRLIPPFLVLIPIGTAFAAFSGILIDLHFPKLSWDNAYKAVKQNMNVLIHMAVCALVAGLTVGVVLIFRWPQAKALRILVLTFSLIDIALYRFLMTRGAKIFSEIEV